MCKKVSDCFMKRNMIAEFKNILMNFNIKIEINHFPNHNEFFVVFFKIIKFSIRFREKKKKIFLNF